ncbi:hypothetical protein GGI09_004145 [Coemansia sp. S100]|nr:hypothetical protein GGI09_004145 [Coemansia sp. S100]
MRIPSLPTTSPFPASIKPPPTWSEVKAQSDPGVLRVAGNMALAVPSGDTLVSFSLQPSSVSAIPDIYAVAYSLETGSIIAPVGWVKTSEFGPLGIAKGGMVSMRIPEAVIKRLASTSRLSAVRLVIFAPEATTHESASRKASDSVVLILVRLLLRLLATVLQLHTMLILALFYSENVWGI